MNTLCLDIGNTSITYCKVLDGALQPLNRLSKFEDTVDFFNHYNINSINQIVISSVVPKLSQQIVNLFQAKDLNIFEISHKNCEINHLFRLSF